MSALTRTKTGESRPVYTVDGPSGALSFEAAFAQLSADGDLPPWVVAYDYAADCRDSLAEDGEEGLWACMEMLYRRAEAPR